MDVQKAFDKVPHRRLLFKFRRYGIRGKILNWIEGFLTHRKQRVVIEGEYSNWVNVDSSVPQGTVLGSLAFLLFINDLPEGVKSTCRLFADDCILYSKVSGPEDANRLQNDLDKLSAWQDKWQLGFNAQNCHVMPITHTRTPFLQQYKLNGVILEEKKSHTYLGVDLCKDLTWNTHVDRICSKANRTIGFLQRNLHVCPTHIKDMSYKTLVRPILDYCSSVWDPYTQTLIKQIEAVQNRAARFVTGNHSRRSSVTAMKLKLNWEPLELRRKVGRLTNFHEAIAGRLAIPVRSALRPAGRNLRQPLQQIVISPYQQINIAINSHSFRAQYQNGINCLTL